jgi:ribose transport system ATP-binding protein
VEPKGQLRFSGIAKRFGATVALSGVDLSFRPGEVHALIGENGAGKSTLMNVLAGAIQPDEGEMWLDGNRYAPGSPLDARRSGVALIHQEISLCPHLTVAENILLGAESSRMGWIDRAASRRRALAIMESFPHPEIGPDRRVGSLPVAAQQVVEICRALSANARVLLMDEPTSSLQRHDVERLFALIRRLRADGVAVVYISHFLEEVREIADRYTVLRDGEAVDSGELASVDNEHLISRMVGRTMGGLYPERVHFPDGEIVLDVRDLSAPPAVIHASLQLRRGEILGIAGLVGSGRTELVRSIFGLDPATDGTLTLRAGSERLGGAHPGTRVRQGFGFLSEDRKGEGLALPLSIADNLTLTGIRACGRRWGWIDLRRQHRRADEWITRLGIRARSARQPVRTLSGGNQQKVAVGRLLHQDAEILLLDEPTRGIDIGSKAQVYASVARAAEQGKAVLLVSSYLPELFGMCDRVAVMCRGRLSPPQPIGDWTPESVMSAAIGEVAFPAGSPPRPSGETRV